MQAVKDQGVDFIVACMDLNGEINLNKALRAAGINNVKFWAPQGYDSENLKKYGNDLQGMYFITDFVPFELSKGNKEMTAFLSSMKKARTGADRAGARGLAERHAAGRRHQGRRQELHP